VLILKYVTFSLFQVFDKLSGTENNAKKRYERKSYEQKKERVETLTMNSFLCSPQSTRLGTGQLNWCNPYQGDLRLRIKNKNKDTLSAI